MLCPNKAIRAIFFDLDNVLVFSERLHFVAWQKVIESHGVNPTEILYQEMMGKTDLLQAHLFAERFKISNAQSLYEQKKSIFLSLCTVGFEHPLGRNDFLIKLSQHYVIGLVSSSNNQIIQKVIDSEGITHHFSFTIGFEDCTQHKPNPEPYLMALAKANVGAHEALVIEDSLPGIRAAQEAKIPVIGIFKDQAPEQLLQEIHYFNSFCEVDAWLHS